MVPESVMGDASIQGIKWLNKKSFYSFTNINTCILHTTHTHTHKDTQSGSYPTEVQQKKSHVQREKKDIHNLIIRCCDRADSVGK